MKLVSFENGTYGIRVYWKWGWYFRDLENPDRFRNRMDSYFKNCKGTKEKAIEILDRYSDKHNVLKTK